MKTLRPDGHTNQLDPCLKCDESSVSQYYISVKRYHLLIIFNITLYTIAIPVGRFKVLRNPYTNITRESKQFNPFTINF